MLSVRMQREVVLLLLFSLGVPAVLIALVTRWSCGTTCGKDGHTQAQIENAQVGIELFRLEQHRLPDTLQDLVSKPDYVAASKWPPGGYLRKVPRDGWGQPLLYERSETDKQGFKLGSLRSPGSGQ